MSRSEFAEVWQGVEAGLPRLILCLDWCDGLGVLLVLGLVSSPHWRVSPHPATGTVFLVPQASGGEVVVLFIACQRSGDPGSFEAPLLCEASSRREAEGRGSKEPWSAFSLVKNKF